jgi:carboxyl-terminal processing protease
MHIEQRIAQFIGTLLLTGAILTTAAACDSDDNDSRGGTAGTASSAGASGYGSDEGGGSNNGGSSNAGTNGLWVTEGYGYLAEVTENTHLYELTDISCIPVAGADALFEGVEILSDDRVRLSTDDPTSPVTAVRIDSLPAPCRDGGTPTVGTDGYERSPQFVFDVLWNTFNEQYAFFKLHGVDWDSLRERYRARITPSTTDQELFDTLGEMLKELADGHVNLFDTDTQQLLNAGARSPSEQAFYDSFLAQDEIDSWDEYLIDASLRKLDIIKTTYLGGEQETANNQLRWGWLNTKTSYLGIDGMQGYASGDNVSYSDELAALDTSLDQVFADLSGAENLVIDVRLNGGGYDLVSLAILSRLIDEPVEVFTKQARNGTGWAEPHTATAEPSTRPGFLGKKIVVLTSSFTASAAEIFAMGTLDMPNATRIGEPTAGGFSNMLTKTLPNGWQFSLSNERYTAVDGKCYEGLGIPVNIDAALFPLSDREQGVDSGIDAALAELARD